MCTLWSYTQVRGLDNFSRIGLRGVGVAGNVPQRLKKDAERVTSGRKGVPQRLKPYCKGMTCGTGEPVPLSKTGFFSTL